jgi:hypothetical protein
VTGAAAGTEAESDIAAYRPFPALHRRDACMDEEHQLNRQRSLYRAGWPGTDLRSGQTWRLTFCSTLISILTKRVVAQRRMGSLRELSNFDWVLSNRTDSPGAAYFRAPVRCAGRLLQVHLWLLYYSEERTTTARSALNRWAHHFQTPPGFTGGCHPALGTTYAGIRSCGVFSGTSVHPQRAVAERSASGRHLT